MKKKTSKKITIEDRKKHQVAIYNGVVHRLPFTVTNKRDKDKNWKHERIMQDGTKIEMKAIQTITPTDIFALIAAVKVFQDKMQLTDNDVEGSNFFEKPMIKVEIGMHEFSNNYLSNMSKQLIVDTFDRLATLMVTVKRNDGSQSIQRYLYDYRVSANQKSITFIISKAFYNICTGEKLWLLNWDIAKKIKSQTGKALFLYLSGNLGTMFSQDLIENLLDMNNSTSIKKCDNRKQIKSAMDELMGAKFIFGYNYNKETGNYVLIRKKPKKIDDAIIA